MSEIVRVASGDFTGHAALTDRVVSVTFAGTADYAALDAVEELLNSAHDAAVANGATHAEVDFTKLEFMNSSSFKCMVSWITELQELPAEKRYIVRITSNPQLHWQRRSLQALRGLATDLVEVA